MKKQRWLSLVLILALVVGLCSVCAAAADDQTAEQPAQEAADTVAEAEAAPADGTQPDAAAAEANTETAEQPEQDAAAETDAAAEEAPADGTHIHAVNREDACEEPAFEPLTVRGGQLESGCGSDAGAYRVLHAQGGLDEQALLRRTLGPIADQILTQGNTEIQKRF